MSENQRKRRDLRVALSTIAFFFAIETIFDNENLLTAVLRVLCNEAAYDTKNASPVAGRRLALDCESHPPSAEPGEPPAG